MKTKLKKHGGSLVIVIPLEFADFHNLKIGDWVELDEAIKIYNKSKRVRK